MANGRSRFGLRTAPAEPAQPEAPGLLRRFLAGGARVAGGLYPGGGPIGALAGAGGETVAELIEGDLSPARITAEAAIGAVPFAKYIKAGKAAESAIRSGLMSGSGEALRQVARGEELDPGAIGIAGGLGAATGGILGKIIPAPAVKPPAPKPVDMRAKMGLPARISTTQVADEEIKFITKHSPREAENLALEAEAAGNHELADKIRNTYIQTGKALPTTLNRQIRSQQRATKTAEDVASKQKIEREIQERGLKPKAPSIRKTTSGQVPGGRISQSVSYGKPKAGQRPSDVGAIAKAIGVKPADVPPSGSPAREVFDAWVARGKDPKTALRLAEEGRVPTLEAQLGVGEAVEEVAAPVAAEAPRVAKAAPAIASKEVTEQAPRAEFLGWQETGDPNSPAIPLYNVFGGRLNKSTVSTESLKAEGIAIPHTPPAPGVTAGIAETVPEAVQEPGQLAKFFKSPVDVVGEAYRGAKAEEGINPLAKRYLGTALGAEASRAGLPSKTRPEALGAFLKKEVEPAVTARFKGLEQPAEAVTEGVKPMSRFMPDEPMSRGAQRTVEDELELGQKLKDLGVAPEDVGESIGLIERLRRLNRGESGAASPEIMANLAMGLGGAAVGGIADPFDNPVLSALAGAGAGLSVPHVISGIRALGVQPEQLGDVQTKLQTPEGVAEVARTIGRSIPHLQRFNFLASAQGLPANAVAGPYGSAFMGALTKALSGDPRGWAAIRELTPNKFYREFRDAQTEATELLRSARGVGRYEAASPTEDVPGALGQVLEIPAKAMTMGDLAARNILERVGFDVDEARVMTLTSEPELPTLHKLANLRRGTKAPFLETLFPFVRTPANIAEQGAMSAPGLGFLVESMRETPRPFKEQLVQQGLSAGVGAGAYLAGETLDPETARYARRYVTNLSGRYSLPAALGFTAGQASQRGQPLFSPAMAQEVERSLPLPTAEPFADLIRLISSGRVPRGAYPALFREFGEEATPRLAPVAQGRFGLRRN